jgi:NADP-dependent 3-hydroxy acid dehydrogenase YdfG
MKKRHAQETAIITGAIADSIHWLLILPPHVHVREIMIRPAGQSYP